MSDMTAEDLVALGAISGCLLMGQGVYETPHAHAAAILKRLAHEGLCIVRSGPPQSAQSAEASKIVGLRGEPTPDQPVPSVVEALGDLLVRASAGQIRAIAYALVSSDGSTGTGWAKPEFEVGDVALSRESHGLGHGILVLSVRYGSDP